MEKIIGHKNKYEMKNKDWNPDEWQGRSRKNVETSYKFAFISMVGMIVTLIAVAIIG